MNAEELIQREIGFIRMHTHCPLCNQFDLESMGGKCSVRFGSGGPNLHLFRCGNCSAVTPIDLWHRIAKQQEVEK